MSCSRYLPVALLAAFAASGAGAQDARAPIGEPGRPWMLALSTLRDQDSYENLFASFHFGISDETWFSLTAGQSNAPSAETDVRANLTALSLEHDFGPIGLALTGEQWGDKNNLESHDWRGEVFFSGEAWRVSLAHETRDIDIWFSGFGTAPVATDLRRLSIEADGTGFDWRAGVGSLWQVYGSWMNYDYPRAMRFVPRADRLDLLSTSSVTLAYSFIDAFTTIGFERSVGRKLINVDFSRDRSTIDAGTLRSIGASVLLPVATRMDLEFRLGTSRSGGFGSAAYGGLTLLYYGGG